MFLVFFIQGKGELYDSAHQRRHTYEDDLTLLGEHIEVPADHAVDDGYGFGVADRLHPQMAPPEAMAPHYSGYEGQHIHHHLPTAGAALPSPKVVFNVKFKRTQRSFVLGPRIQRDLKVGTYVKVEADRGEDLGIVIGKVLADKYAFSGRTAYRSPSMTGITELMPSPTGLSPPGATDLKCIIRLATHDEVSLLAMKREEEEELLKICRTKVRQRGLPMNVVDAEYQFDRHKLTFFFEAEGRIDFRELVRDLFSIYKTRIWMQQLDKNVALTPGVSPPPSTMLDYGTPIIAPASEFSDTFIMNSLASGN
jgi:PSP1 C-terminal conserved region